MHLLLLNDWLTLRCIPNDLLLLVAGGVNLYHTIRCLLILHLQLLLLLELILLN